MTRVRDATLRTFQLSIVYVPTLTAHSSDQSFGRRSQLSFDICAFVIKVSHPAYANMQMLAQDLEQRFKWSRWT